MVLQSVSYTLHLALNRDTQAFHLSQESVDFQSNALEPLFSGTQGGVGGEAGLQWPPATRHAGKLSETQLQHALPLRGPSATCPSAGHSTFQQALLHPCPAGLRSFFWKVLWGLVLSFL